MRKLDSNAFILLTLRLDTMSCSFTCDIPFPGKLHGFGIKYFSQLVISRSDIIFTTAAQQYCCVAVVKIMKNQAKHYFHNWNTTGSQQHSCVPVVKFNVWPSFSLFSQLPKFDHIYASGLRASQRLLL